MKYTEGIITLVKPCIQKFSIIIDPEVSSFSLHVELRPGSMTLSEFNHKLMIISACISDTAYLTSDSRLLSLICETDSIISSRISDGVRSEHYHGHTICADIHFANIVSDDPLLVANVSMIESLIAKAIEYTYSQIYAADVEPYPTDRIQYHDINDASVSVRLGELYIFGRQAKSDQAVIDKFDEEIATRVLKWFYYYLINAPEFGKPARRLGCN